MPRTSICLLICLVLQADQDNLSLSDAMTQLKQQAEEMAQKAQKEAETAAAELAEADSQLQNTRNALETEQNSGASLQVGEESALREVQSHA